MQKRTILNGKEFLADYFEACKHLEEGEKVMLRYDAITSRPLYKSMRQDYKDFIEAHKNDVFTVVYDAAFRTESPTIVCLKEDPTEPKILWSEMDLTRVVNEEAPDKGGSE